MLSEPLEYVTVIEAEVLIVTSSPAPGTAPPLQFDAVFQLPPVVLVQEMDDIINLPLCEIGQQQSPPEAAAREAEANAPVTKTKTRLLSSLF
jgi:hypothetical protein